jgi:hypothetical protein
MKNFLFSSFFSLLLSCSQAPNNEVSQPLSLDKNGHTITKIKFDYYKVDSGEVAEGTKVEYEFPFTNIGDSPLVFSGCRRSDSDLRVDYPKEPILPNKSGVLKVELPTTVKTHKHTKNLAGLEM